MSESNEVFEQMDVVEEKLGVAVGEMNPNQLLTYFEWAMGEIVGIKIAPGGVRQVAIMKGLQSRYGTEDAGKIVKWAIHEEKGKINGDHLTISSWTDGCRWITDRFYARVQLAEKERRRTAEGELKNSRLREGFLGLGDL